MKVKTNQVLTNLKGDVIKEDTTEVTLGMVISASLLNSEGQTDPERAYKLAKECTLNEEVNLKAEDITFIKEHLTRSVLPTLLTGQAITLLDV